MSLTDRADDLLKEIIYCDLRTSTGIDKTKKAIRLALKEQDKITRDACAEEMLKLPSCICDDVRCVALSAAEMACMNVKAV